MPKPRFAERISLRRVRGRDATWQGPGRTARAGASPQGQESTESLPDRVQESTETVAQWRL